MSTADEEWSDYLNDKNDQFEQLCAERHEKGQSEYGNLTFLGNDVLRMMLEELADVANYCKMHAIKLLILQEQLEANVLPEAPGVVPAEGTFGNIGWTTHVGTKPTGWGKDWQ